MTELTMKDVKEEMPHAKFPPIGSATKAPTAKEIGVVYSLACANTRKINSNRGDGLLGHFAIIAGPGHYVASSTGGVDYVPPPKPPQQPLTGTSVAARELNRLVWQQEWNEFNTHKHVEDITLQQQLESTHPTYTARFKTEEGGYNCTANVLMQHLMVTWGQKTDKDLKDNKKEMEQPWDPKLEPIEALFNRVHDGRLFDPTITEASIVRDTKNIICLNDGFQESFKTWEAKPAAEKTWINLQMHFRDAATSNQSLLDLKRQTNPGTYSGADNSATTPISNTPPKETAQLLIALATMTTALSKLTEAAPASGSTGNTNSSINHVPRRNNPTTGGRAPTAAEAATMSYCWSHGFCNKARNGQPAHTSASCTRPNVGHKTEATVTNKLGGECRICNSWKATFHGMPPNGE